MEIVIVVLLVVLIIRNALKDKSDGRNYLGGWRKSSTDTQKK